MNPLISECREFLHNTTLTPQQQLLYLSGKLESSTEESDKSWIRYQMNLIRQLTYSPTPRQKVVGNKRGRLSQRDQDYVTLHSAISDAQSLIKESYDR